MTFREKEFVNLFTETIADKLAYDDWLDVRQTDSYQDSQIRVQYTTEIKIHYIPTGIGVCV